MGPAAKAVTEKGLVGFTQSSARDLPGGRLWNASVTARLPRLAASFARDHCIGLKLAHRDHSSAEKLLKPGMAVRMRTMA
jgi:hypothetical protein